MQNSITASGLGLRTQHFSAFQSDRPRLDFLEVVAENLMRVGGNPRRVVETLRADYEFQCHGVALSIGSPEPVAKPYLRDLRALVDWLEPQFVSDHLCWTRIGRKNSHDLLPLPYTQACLDRVVTRVHAVQEALGRRLYLENPSAYVQFAANEMTEAEFLAQLCARSGCGILLDVNNLFVNAMNLATDMDHYLDQLRPDWICYMHLAGHTVLPHVRIDTHDEPVCEDVWQLFRRVAQRFPAIPYMIERDDKIPELPILLAELAAAQRIHAEAVATPSQVRAAVVVSGAVGNQPLPALRATQDRFLGDITAIKEHADDAVLDLLNPSVTVRRLDGINVYTSAYHLRLCEVMRGVYPTLTKFLGVTAFDVVLCEYLRQHPPHHYSVKFCGALLPRFFQTATAPVLAKVSNRLLADIAKLEWARELVFDAEDPVAVVGAPELQLIPLDEWYEQVATLVPAHTLITTVYPVDTLIQAVESGEEPAPPRPASRRLLVYRDGANEIYTRALSTREAFCLRQIQRGKAIGVVCEKLAAHEGLAMEDAIPVAMSHLVALVNLGIVATLQVPPPKRQVLPFHPEAKPQAQGDFSGEMQGK